MGFPIQGQHYNLVSLAFYVGEAFFLITLVIEQLKHRVLVLGVPDYVYISENAYRKIPRCVKAL